MAIGATAVVAGLAAPAAAHEGKEPDKITDSYSLSCADLAERYGVDGADWTQSKIESGNLPPEGETATYELVEGDDLTPGYEGDGPSVTITMNVELKNFDWESTVGIDAIYVKGGSSGSHFYGYQPEIAGYNEAGAGTIVGDGAEATSDVDLSSPPYGSRDKGRISHVTFCWDEEGSGTSTTTTTETPPTNPCPDTPGSGDMPGDDTPPYGDTPGEDCGSPNDTTTTTAPPPNDTPTTTLPLEPSSSTSVVANPVPDAPSTTGETMPPTSVPTTDGSGSGSLPNTGSNTTTPLVVGGLALLAVGGGLVAGVRWLRRA